MGSFQPPPAIGTDEPFPYARRASAPGDYDCADDPGAFAHFPHGPMVPAEPVPSAPTIRGSLAAAFLSGVAWIIATSAMDG